MAVEYFHHFRLRGPEAEVQAFVRENRSKPILSDDARKRLPPRLVGEVEYVYESALLSLGATLPRPLKYEEEGSEAYFWGLGADLSENDLLTLHEVSPSEVRYELQLRNENLIAWAEKIARAYPGLELLLEAQDDSLQHVRVVYAFAGGVHAEDLGFRELPHREEELEEEEERKYAGPHYEPEEGFVQDFSHGDFIPDLLRARAHEDIQEIISRMREALVPDAVAASLVAAYAPSLGLEHIRWIAEHRGPLLRIRDFGRLTEEARSELEEWAARALKVEVPPMPKAEKAPFQMTRAERWQYETAAAPVHEARNEVTLLWSILKPYAEQGYIRLDGPLGRGLRTQALTGDDFQGHIAAELLLRHPELPAEEIRALVDGRGLEAHLYGAVIANHPKADQETKLRTLKEALMSGRMGGADTISLLASPRTGGDRELCEWMLEQVEAPRSAPITALIVGAAYAEEPDDWAALVEVMSRDEQKEDRSPQWAAAECLDLVSTASEERLDALSRDTVERLMSHDNPQVRAWAAETAVIKERIPTDDLARLMTSEEPFTARAATVAVLTHASPDQLAQIPSDLLVGLLGHDDREIRALAIMATDRFPDLSRKETPEEPSPRGRTP